MVKKEIHYAKTENVLKRSQYNDLQKCAFVLETHSSRIRLIHLFFPQDSPVSITETMKHHVEQQPACLRVCTNTCARWNGIHITKQSEIYDKL